MGTALITGITGQDGRYLAEFLHEHGYRIFGLMTGQNNPKAELLSEEFPFVELVGGDLQDLSSLIAAIHYCEPDEILQPRRDLIRAALVRAARVDREHHGTRCVAAARGNHGLRAAARIGSSSTKPLRARCTGRCASHLKLRGHLSIRAARTGPRKYSDTTSR